MAVAVEEQTPRNETQEQSNVRRGLSKPRERAELEERLFRASEALRRAVERLHEALGDQLLGHRESSAIGPAEVELINADNEFEEARAAAVRFLHSLGGKATV